MDATDIRDASQDISKDDSNWGEPHNWHWGGLRCHWRLLGENNQRPLVLLHGFGVSSSHWRHNALPFAAAGFQVYALDLIGFGDSEQPSQKIVPKLDNQFWAKQVSAFLEEVVQTKKHGKAILIGNSLGGLVALTTVCFQPELVSAVVAAPLPDPAFMNPAAKNDHLWWKKVQKKLLGFFFNLLPLEVFVPLISHTILIKIALQAAYHRSIKRDKILQRLITKPAKRPTAARALRGMCIGMSTRNHSITAPALLTQLKEREYRSPMLLIWGRQDNLVPLFLSKALLKQHPWLNLHVLDQTGHCPHDESPKQFNEKVLKWLDTNLEDDRQNV